jgi:transposase
MKEERVIFYVDEAGVGLLPSLGKTYAPKGKTPVIAHKCRYKHLSVISAICEAGKMFWDIRHDAFKGLSIVQFLKDMLDYAKKKILVIWDGASIHRSDEVKSFLASLQDGEVWLERIPPYSPELNADEQVWYHLKAVALKNTCAHNLKELESNVKYAMKGIEENLELIQSFFKHPEVGYYQL